VIALIATQAIAKTTQEVTPINSKPTRENSGRHPRGGGAGFGILLTLLLASAAALTSYWTWQQSNMRDEVQNKLELGVGQLLESIEQQRESVNQRLAAQQNHQHQQLQQRLLALETKISRAEQPLAVERWTVAEARYLINMAEHRYHLEQNREMAISALEQARKQLLQQRSMAFTAALELLSQTITQLESLDDRRDEQIINQLSQLVTLIPQLPIARKGFEMESTAPASDYSLKSVEGWRQYSSALWYDLQQLFRIKRPGQTTAALSQPIAADIYPILRQQLMLKVEFARIAMLSRSPLYVTTLRELIPLIKRYFDVEDETVKGEIARLEQMVTAAEQELPLINFEAIRQQLPDTVMP
jgi:uncharacterized protein HemX